MDHKYTLMTSPFTDIILFSGEPRASVILTTGGFR